MLALSLCLCLSLSLSLSLSITHTHTHIHTARAIAKHALSIFGDHQDVMAVRQVCDTVTTGRRSDQIRPADLSRFAHVPVRMHA